MCATSATSALLARGAGCAHGERSGPLRRPRAAKQPSSWARLRLQRGRELRFISPVGPRATRLDLSRASRSGRPQRLDRG